MGDIVDLIRFLIKDGNLISSKEELEYLKHKRNLYEVTRYLDVLENFTYVIYAEHCDDDGRFYFWDLTVYREPIYATN